MTYGLNKGAKSIRRNAALLRQANRDERTPDEQLALLNTRPGRSLRERARLAP